MTSEQLIEEGRTLQRPCMFLRPQGEGPVAAVWYEDDGELDARGNRCWLTVDARQVPGLVTGCLSIFTDDKKCEGGRVEVTAEWPKRAGTALYAHAASVLPPIEVVFMRGSEVVGEWLRVNGWERTERYNDNFGDAAVVEEYERMWQKEYPIYLDDGIYAVLGGWHFPMADDDWHELVEEQLMVMTLRGAEPWVEAWRMRTGEMRVIQRMT